MTTFKHYTTPDSGEKPAILPGGAKRTVVFSLCIDDVLPGDVLIITGQMEATSDVYNPVMFGSNCLLTPNPLAVEANGSLGTVECVENNSFNVTRDMHHGVATKVASWAVTKAIPVAYVNLVAWANNMQNQGLRVEKDYGKLSVVKLRARA